MSIILDLLLLIKCRKLSYILPPGMTEWRSGLEPPLSSNKYVEDEDVSGSGPPVVTGSEGLLGGWHKDRL